MDKLTTWLTHPPLLLSSARAWLTLGGAVVYAWLMVCRATDGHAEPVQLANSLLLALVLLVMALGSLLPENRGGLALRRATVWLCLPLIVALALLLADVARAQGSLPVLGLVLFVVALMSFGGLTRQRRGPH